MGNFISSNQQEDSDNESVPSYHGRGFVNFHMQGGGRSLANSYMESNVCVMEDVNDHTIEELDTLGGNPDEVPAFAPLFSPLDDLEIRVEMYESSSDEDSSSDDEEFSDAQETT
ncbi:uncharacterized protein LOC108099638 [Drosophila ficusphila]|uniref:uncharacterized protein LOC108099638 n=1 Tax=Drosophila ficusphila TaxID=30025 RepID=UPI0007E6DF7D|nr:uncharacterized protein LOC108099638 [Drosophila ficusphila]